MTVIGLPELPRDSLILGSIIAEGSGGVQVFDAQLRDPVTRHEINVAVKQFPVSSSEEQGVVFTEMAVHAAVARSTSNVCLPHGWCFDGEGSLWLVMRKYARSLADRMREEPLSAEDLERYSKTLCKTMEDLERCFVFPHSSSSFHSLVRRICISIRPAQACHLTLGQLTLQKQHPPP